MVSHVRHGEGLLGSLLLLLPVPQSGHPVGPLDGPAADLAHGQLGVVITKQAANEVVGEQVGISMAAAPAGAEPVDRGKVAA